MIHIKRVYEDALPGDGKRFLVERLWPRGIKKERLKMDGWFKDVAPSTELRKWFSHDPSKWEKFKELYFEELNRNQSEVNILRGFLSTGKATLLYSSKDTEHNNAVALKEYLEIKRKKKNLQNTNRILSILK
jgi:uncharacterized protein YeaO (DUF488 family)